MQTIENLTVLERFEELRAAKANPTLAVYRGRKVVIASEEVSGPIAKVAQLCRKIVYAVLTRIGMLSTDQPWCRSSRTT